jgi:hypothetical protein
MYHGKWMALSGHKLFQTPCKLLTGGKLREFALEQRLQAAHSAGLTDDVPNSLRKDHLLMQNRVSRVCHPKVVHR